MTKAAKRDDGRGGSGAPRSEVSRQVSHGSDSTSSCGIDAPLLSVTGLEKRFDLPRSMVASLLGQPAAAVHAVRGVDLQIARGETLGLIGESGCGKSTLGRLVLRLHEPSAGCIVFDGRDITRLGESELRPLRRRMQIVFQDPYASLNPRRTVEEIVGAPLYVHDGLGSAERRARVLEMLDVVGLARAHLTRYPHQFSGGQRQRIGIARALILRPDFVVCDEPVSALDVSVQAQVMALIEELKAELSLTYLFISHDLAVVAHLADRVAVMYLGRIVELGPRREVLSTPRHPYTQTLLASVPALVRGSLPVAERRATGEPPSPLSPPSGCEFHPRCPLAGPTCRNERPQLRAAPQSESVVACHYPATGASLPT